MEGMVAIAVPVHDPQNRFVAALATHGPKSRIPLERLLEYREILSQGASQIAKTVF